MKFFNLKLRKDKIPSLKSLRMPLFNIELYWLLILLISFLIIFFTVGIGFKLFYNEYFEGYKNTISTEQFGDILNIQRLERVIEKRNEFINASTTIPRDPSI